MEKKHPNILYWNQPATLTKLVTLLSSNGCAITSTDTILGLLAPITSEGYKQLVTLKGKRQAKPFVVLTGSTNKLATFVDQENVSPRLRSFLDKIWPGPATIIFKARKDLPTWLKSADGTIALRCPAHHGLQQLLTSFDGLFSTSANKSGGALPKTIEEIHPDLLTNCGALVLDAPSETLAQKPSTILDCSTILLKPQGAIRLIREGSYPIDMLEKYYGESFDR